MLYVLENIAVSALHEIKHKVYSQDTYKAQGKAECFINIEACTECFTLRRAQTRQCFNCFRGSL